MQKYAFILGHRPLLSLAELESFFAQQKIGTKIRRYGGKVAVAELSKELKAPAEILSKLGGTVKIIQITQESPSTLTTARQHLQAELTSDSLVEKYFIQTKQKVFFGFSLYPLAQNVSSKDLQMFLRTYGVDLKRELKDKGIKSRFVVGQQSDLSSVIVQKNRLLTRGAEVDIIFDKQYLAIGKTVAVQDFDDYSLRDYGRPESNAKKGMMPPKLAQLLINLARLSEASTVLDPFCGVGTVLQEALLKNMKVIGTDIDPNMIGAAKKNLDWLIETYRLEKENIVKIKEVDVRFIGKHLKTGSVEAVISESTLGPAMVKAPSVTGAKRNVEKLNRLFIDGFRALHRILKPKGMMVITLPYYILPKERIFMPILDNISDFGYTQKVPFSDELAKKLKIRPTERGTLLYERPRQVVGREVIILQKK